MGTPKVIEGLLDEIDKQNMAIKRCGRYFTLCFTVGIAFTVVCDGYFSDFVNVPVALMVLGLFCVLVYEVLLTKKKNALREQLKGSYGLEYDWGFVSICESSAVVRRECVAKYICFDGAVPKLRV